MADVTVREATPIDFADVAAMHYSVWRQSWSGVLPAEVLDTLTSPKRWSVLLYPRDLSRPGWRMWVAEAGGQLLGMTIFGPDPDDRERLELDALYISQGRQRHGVGGLLLAKALDSDPRGDVVLWCAEANGVARRFYEKNDFHLDGRTLGLGAGARRQGAPPGLSPQASMTIRSPSARETHTSMPSSPGTARPR